MTKTSPLSKKQCEDLVRAAGFDPAALNWKAILQIVMAILQQFLTPVQAKAKAAGCSEHDQLMHDTARLNLEAACNCLQCCESEGA